MKTYYTRFFILSILCFSFLVSFSQECFWSSQAGGTLSDQSGYIVLDKNGNSYIGGGFSSNPIMYNTGSANSLGQNDMMIIKYDPLGNEVWTRSFGGYNPSNEPFEFIGSMVVDTLNSRLLVTGSFFNSLSLPDTVLTGENLTVYLFAVDFDNNILWARAGGGIGIDKGYGLTYDLQGNIYISGTNGWDATFEGVTIPKGGFLIKYNKNGDMIWAKNKFRYTHQGGDCEAPPLNLCMLNQNLIVNGNAAGETIVIDTISIAIPSGTNAAYISSFSPEGDVQWLRIAGAPDGSTGRQISIDKTGNIYFTGTLYGPIGYFEQDTIHSVYGDCFITKYTSEGTYQWARGIQPSKSAMGWGIVSDKGNTIYFSGTFDGTAHFGQLILTAESPSDMFIARYTGEGTCIGVNQYSRGLYPGINVDYSGNLFMTGSFLSTLVVGPQPLQSRGSYDMFIAKCSPITGIVQPKPESSNTLLIYANPNTGQCRVTIPEEFNHETTLILEIYDQTGRLIQKAQLNITGDSIELDISAQVKGMYNAILSNGKKYYSGKIIFE